jgi:hypothetical protein
MPHYHTHLLSFYVGAKCHTVYKPHIGHLFIHSFIYSFVHSFIRPFVWFTYAVQSFFLSL